MRILICGIDGYLGWSLAQHLKARGHEITGIDAGLRRKWVEEMESISIFEIPSIEDRCCYFDSVFGGALKVYPFSLARHDKLEDTIKESQPEAIVHLAEQPSAPFSMRSAASAAITQSNNVIGTLHLLHAIRDHAPDAHLLKIGTMGQYGTPSCLIPEGFFPDGSLWTDSVELPIGDISGLPFPQTPGSFYHASKCHDSVNIRCANRWWGIRATDIMQGVVYGTRIPLWNTLPERDRHVLRTRFDIDECFGTAINRFVASAIISQPLTLYGKGFQKRGFLPLCDSMQCLTIALENPPEVGEYRVWNQYEDIYDLTQLAETVASVATEFNLTPEIAHYENPRKELEDHVYQSVAQHLNEQGYQPTADMASVLREMFEDLIPLRERIESVRERIIPEVRWEGILRKSEVLP